MFNEMLAISSGGGLGEPVNLWHNTSPNTAYAGTTTAMSLTTGKFSDYKYIRFDYKYNKSTSSDNYVSVMVDIDSWTKMTVSNLTYLAMVGTLNSIAYVRVLQYLSDTQLNILPAYAMNTAGTNNDMVIPLDIWGIK